MLRKKNKAARISNTSQTNTPSFRSNGTLGAVECMDMFICFEIRFQVARFQATGSGSGFKTYTSKSDIDIDIRNIAACPIFIRLRMRYKNIRPTVLEGSRNSTLTNSRHFSVSNTEILWICAILSKNGTAFSTVWVLKRKLARVIGSRGLAAGHF
jgi:hypothetical protein